MNAPMTASIQLHHSPLDLLNQLFHLDATQLTIRSHGVTLLKPTEFGVFFHQEEEGEFRLQDPVSGLTIDPRYLEAIYAVPLLPDHPPALEFKFAQGGFAASIQCGRQPNSLAVMERLLRHFGPEPVNTDALRSLGVGAWLDEWRPETPHIQIDPLELRELRDSIEQGYETLVTLELPGLTMDTVLRPSFIDQDSNVLRICCPDSETVLFVDGVSSEPADGWLRLKTIRR